MKAQKDSVKAELRNNLLVTDRVPETGLVSGFGICHGAQRARKFKKVQAKN